jgi:protein transport protein SEC24
VDAAQHAEWARVTGGEVRRYAPFQPARDHAQLLNDLVWAVRREQGCEAMLRLRCSQGVDVDGYVGSLVRRETGAARSTRLWRMCLLSSVLLCAYTLARG